MRNPLPVLCAVALSIALATSASADPGITLKRSDWQVVVPGSDVAAAVKKVCDPQATPPGTLAATKAAVNERSESWCAGWGFNCKIPLSCIRMNADGSASVSPVDATVLELTVYVAPFSGGSRDFKLNRSPRSSAVAVRDANGTELTYVAPAPAPPAPAPKVPGKPSPKQPAPKPGTHPKPHPGTTQPAPKPGANAQTELSLLERSWMIPDERKPYLASIDASKKPTVAALQAAYKKARETVAANLRKELQTPYTDMVKAGKFDEIDGILTGKSYSGFEVQLRPEEYEALKKIVKTADAHTDFVAPNAAAQYDLEMQKPVDDQDGKPHPLKESLFAEHLLAYQVTKKFRDMLAPKPGQQADPAAMLTDADFAHVPGSKERAALQKKYAEDWAKADTDDKKAALNKDYRARIDKLAAGAPDLTKLTPEERAAYDKEITDAGDDQAKRDAVNLKYRKQLALRDKTTYDGFDPGQKTDFCAPYKNAIIASDAAAAAGACKPEEKVQKTVACKTDPACVARVAKECGDGTASAPSGAANSSVPPITDPDVRKACFDLNAGAAPQGDTTKPSAAGDVPNPCGKKSDAAAAPTDTTKAGKDADPCPKKDDKKDDPNFYTNVGNGIAFGIGGLLLASFLGGPALMLAVGVAAGIGGYYFAKANDEPKKKK